MLLGVDDRHKLLDEEGDFAGEGEDEGGDDVEEKEHEKFAIGEAHAIGDPRAMMIHV